MAASSALEELFENWKSTHNAGDEFFATLIGVLSDSPIETQFEKFRESLLLPVYAQKNENKERVLEGVSHLSWFGDQQTSIQTSFYGSLNRDRGVSRLTGRDYILAWVDIRLPQGTPGRPLPPASAHALRNGFVRECGGDVDLKLLREKLVLFVTLSAPDWELPELVVAGPPQGDSDKSNGIGVLLFQTNASRRDGRTPNEIARNILTQLHSLGRHGAESDWRDVFALSSGDVRSAFRAQVQDALTTIMSLLEELKGEAAKDSELRKLREAASFVLFRMMFLIEVEQRRLLYAGDRPAGGHEALASMAARVGTLEAEKGAFARRFAQVCHAIHHGGDSDIKIAGASIFSTLPSRAFDSTIEKWLRPLDALLPTLDDERATRWDNALSKLAAVVSGQLGLQYANSELRAVGLGGTEHVHRILGDVYEQILAMTPGRNNKGELTLTVKGSKGGKSDRAKLGAHYTPEDIVEEVVRAGLEPLFKHAWDAAAGDVDDYQKRLLALRVCDPAMGSAHFLTVVASEIAREYAWVEVCGMPQPAENFERVEREDPWEGLPEGANAKLRKDIEEGIQQILPRVAQECCYGVDVNPLATELAKLSLWLFTMTAQGANTGDSAQRDENARPELTFLDANLQCGDSLVGMSWSEAVYFIEKQLGITFGEEQQDLFAAAGETVDIRQKKIAELSALVHAPVEEILNALSEDADLGELSGEIESLPDEPYKLRQQLFARISELNHAVQWVYDLAVLALFLGETPRKRGKVEELLKKEGYLDQAIEVQWEEVLSADVAQPPAHVAEIRKALSAAAWSAPLVKGRPLRALHYPLAFPHIFTDDEAGFDCIVANPPFIGDRNLRGAFGAQYKEYIQGYTFNALEVRPMHDPKARYRVEQLTPDFAGFFLLRMCAIARSEHTTVSAVAPNSIFQGKSRRGALVPILHSASREMYAYRVDQSRIWPGVASLFISLLHLQRGLLPSLVRSVRVEPRKSVTQVDRISSHGDSRPLHSSFSHAPHPVELRSIPSLRSSVAMQGQVLRGASSESTGFVHPFAVIERIPAGEFPAVKRYLNNSAMRRILREDEIEVCVDFYGVLDDAEMLDSPPEKQLSYLMENFPECVSLAASVQAARESLTDASSDRQAKSCWWLFANPRPELRKLLRGEEEVLILGRVVKHWAPLILPTVDDRTGFETVFSDAVVIVPGSVAYWSVLTSFLFELFSRRNSSTLKTDMRFSPTEVMDLFPLPRSLGAASDNEAAATQLRHLLECRAMYMESEQSGLTDMYNHFDSVDSFEESVVALREAHRALLEAVLKLYGWHELASRMKAAPGEGWTFDRPWIDGTERYVPAAEFREEMYQLLLDKNEERYWQEIGLYLEELPKRCGKKIPRTLTLAKLKSLCKSADFKIDEKGQPSDLEALWYEGERQGMWKRSGS